MNNYCVIISLPTVLPSAVRSEATNEVEACAQLATLRDGNPAREKGESIYELI
jgi:hypothetical protein